MSNVKRVWTADMDARLGKATDREVGAELGLPKNVISLRRDKLGVQSFAASKWTTDALAKLGTASDARIAEVIGLARTTVLNKRVALGIPPYRTHQGPPRVSSKWTTDALAKLGTITDAEIAKEIGMSVFTVWRERNTRNIPSCAANKRSAVIGSAEFQARLGCAKDAEIASQFNVSTTIVRNERIALGIPPYCAYGQKRPSSQASKHTSGKTRVTRTRLFQPIKWLMEKLSPGA